MNLPIFLQSIELTSKNGRLYFERVAEKRILADWNQGQLKDLKSGSVYVYFDSNDKALYVGETGGGIKARSRFPTSDHRKTTWWQEWRSLYFLPCSDRTDRLTLELLLVLSYQPKGNTKPGSRLISKMFSPSLQNREDYRAV